MRFIRNLPYPMNHETTVKRIQQLVPEVMVLEFGCEVLVQEKYSPVEYLIPMTVLSVNASVREIDTTVYARLSYDDIITILGKPITLAVVLMAIGKINKGGVYLRSDGVFFSWKGFAEGGDGNHKVVSDYIEWNLSKDNFNDQSEETKEFIGELLTDKE